MKLAKLIPATLAVLVISACSSKDVAQEVQTPAVSAVEQATQAANQEANNIAQQINGKAAVNVEKVDTVSKSVVYRCLSNRTLTANYSFVGNEAKAVNLILTKGKKVTKLPTLARDESDNEVVAFKDDKYLWNVEDGFNFDNATTKRGGNLTEKMADADNIMAKLCEVNKRATAKANKK